jgi:hypothetical protein
MTVALGGPQKPYELEDNKYSNDQSSKISESMSEESPLEHQTHNDLWVPLDIIPKTQRQYRHGEQEAM